MERITYSNDGLLLGEFTPNENYKLMGPISRVSAEAIHSTPKQPETKERLKPPAPLLRIIQTSFTTQLLVKKAE